MLKMSTLHSKSKRPGALKILYRIFQAYRVQYHYQPIAFLQGVLAYLRDYRQLGSMSSNPHFSLTCREFIPCLSDRTAHTPLEPTYFYQDSWAAGILFRLKPEHHYDVGSSAMTIGILSQFMPVTMIDIRPLALALDNLFFQEGSILSLPFADNSIESLSSLCVVEHIGLGRYGDPIDPWGSEKAIRELKRVLKPGGNLLVSLPIDEECRVYFNAHRAFTRDYVMELFAGLELVEEKYVYGTALCSTYDFTRGFGTGMFHFRKGLQ